LEVQNTAAKSADDAGTSWSILAAVGCLLGQTLRASIKTGLSGVKTSSNNPLFFITFSLSGLFYCWRSCMVFMSLRPNNKITRPMLDACLDWE